MSDYIRGIEHIRRSRPRYETCLIVTMLLFVSTVPLVASVGTQDSPTDVVFHNTMLRNSITVLGASLGRSVAFDMNFLDRAITFEARNVLKSDALAQLLRRERVAAIEVGSVLIIVADSEEARANYKPERIDACLISVQDATRGDFVLPTATIEKGLTTLAQASGRTARVDASLARYARTFGLELHRVSAAQALQVFCLITHVQVRDGGDVLDFSWDMPLIK